MPPCLPAANPHPGTPTAFPCPPQDDARQGGAGANPLYETNQSQLSAPDSPGGYADAAAGAGAGGAATSVGASMMSARSRQVRALGEE